MPAEAQSFDGDEMLTIASSNANTRVAQKQSRLLVDPFWRHSNDRSIDRWEAYILPKLLQFSEFKPGWDGYNAKPLNAEAAMFTLQVLNNVLRPTTPRPQLVPLSSGGLQIEWHERGIDLEVRINGAYECEYFFEDRLNAQRPTEEKNFGADLSELIRHVDEITSR